MTFTSVTIFNVQVVLTPAEKGMNGAVAMAEALLKKQPSGHILQQFNNPDNPTVVFI
jgi:cysteine synthase A